MHLTLFNKAVSYFTIIFRNQHFIFEWGVTPVLHLCARTFSYVRHIYFSTTTSLIHAKEHIATKLKLCAEVFTSCFYGKTWHLHFSKRIYFVGFLVGEVLLVGMRRDSKTFQLIYLDKYCLGIAFKATRTECVM